MELEEYLDEVDGFVKLRPVVVINGSERSERGLNAGSHVIENDTKKGHASSKSKSILGGILDSFTYMCAPAQCGQFGYDGRKKKRKLSEPDTSFSSSPHSNSAQHATQHRSRVDSAFLDIPNSISHDRKIEDILPPQNFFRPVSEDEDLP